MAVDILSTLNKSGSGLNLSEITNSLVDAEIVPRQTRIQEQVSETQASVSAFAQVRAQLDALTEAMGIASQASALSVSSSDTAVTATVTNSALLSEETVDVQVYQVAQPQVLEFKGLASGADPISAGSLQIDFGVWIETDGVESFTSDPDRSPATLSFAAGATLDDLATALSGIDGVTARIINVGDGSFSLGVVTDEGAARSIRITATPDAPAGPGEIDLSAFDTTATNAAKQVQAATDAMLAVDGITIFRDSNTVTDVIDGVSLTLNSATVLPAQVAITADVDASRAVMQALVDQLNDTLGLLNTLTARGVNGADPGPLAGDTTAEALKRQITGALTQPIPGFSDAPVYLSQLGVRTARDGSLSLDAAVFDAEFARNPAAFEAVFSDILRADVPGVSIDRGPNAGALAGRYEFTLDPDTGTARFGAYEMSLMSQVDGVSVYAVSSGPMAGLRLAVQEGVTATTISYGTSLLTTLDRRLDDALAFSGAIARREGQLDALIGSYAEQMDALNARSEMLQQRYIERFSAMETAVTRLKSTGAYLTNLIAQWNKSD